MSVFSDRLSLYINQKDIKVFSLAKYCSLDRSTMYKIISGKRNPPSLEVLNKISQFMNLTPTEYQYLHEGWSIAQVGEETYYTRKSVENFIRQFPEQPAAEFTATCISSDSLSESEQADCISLTSPQHINHYVHQMILAESGKDIGEIALFIQPDYKFLFSLLASLKASGTLKINHILCVGTEPAFTRDHQLINLKYLREVFPLYMASLDYSLWYYYDRIQSHYYNFNLFPCMILTSDAALLCNSDYQNGIFFRSPDIIQMLWNQYRSYQEQCRIFFRPASVTPESHTNVINTLFDSSYNQNDLIGIQPEPCLTPFFTGRLLYDIFNHDLPQAEKTLQLSEHAFQMNMNKIQNHQFCIYSTMEGLMQFARTGITAEIPEIFYHPLNPVQRIEVLNGVRDCCASGDYRMLQPPFNHLPQNLHFCIRGTIGSMIFRNNSGQIIVLNIEEPRLINIFRDYLENMTSSCYYSPEKSVEMIDQIIKELRSDLSVLQ